MLFQSSIDTNDKQKQLSNHIISTKYDSLSPPETWSGFQWQKQNRERQNKYEILFISNFFLQDNNCSWGLKQGLFPLALWFSTALSILRHWVWAALIRCCVVKWGLPPIYKCIIFISETLALFAESPLCCFHDQLLISMLLDRIT